MAPQWALFMAIVAIVIAVMFVVAAVVGHDWILAGVAGVWLLSALLWLRRWRKSTPTL